MKKSYKGTSDYIASEALIEVVNAALVVERPLLLKGEPGTGKTLLAKSIADSLNAPLLRWNIKSTTKAAEGLYIYDTVQRLNDARFGEGDVRDIKRYIKLGKLGEAFTSLEHVVLLIDEIDKADLEFPNDLLAEIDEMCFYIPETREEITAKNRPLVIITSNAEKELPDAFLRRCLFHFIEFPDEAMMKQIIKVHFPQLGGKLMDLSLKRFYELRAQTGLKKPPSTSELIDWIRVVLASELEIDELQKAELPFLGCLIKKDEDLKKPAKVRIRY